MRIALITDIHGNLAALEAITSDLRRRGVDAVVNLGDSLSGPLLPLETAQYLMAEGWISLAGNHERQILVDDPLRRGPADEFAHSRLTTKEFAWLESLPSTARLSPEIFLCHGTPSSDVQYFLETIDDGFVRAANSDEIESRIGSERSALIACGHTHIPRVVRAKHGQVIVNPGSVGLQAYADVHPSPHFMETGSPDARYAIVEKVRGGWSSSLLSVPYDHRSMANLAKLHGSTRWEHALLTGYCLGDS
jgi:predicted phosphodiesterase